MVLDAGILGFGLLVFAATTIGVVDAPTVAFGTSLIGFGCALLGSAGRPVERNRRVAADSRGCARIGSARGS
ncbi:hypothetical protein ACIBG0_06360 [Nocardia sp. NPDC050630]|uniref:hypothetical protein n=1 Tax=Nocardia sp. NPDC050630 TaxID=3364321 RepID=UPI003787CCC4